MKIPEIILSDCRAVVIGEKVEIFTGMTTVRRPETIMSAIKTAMNASII